MSRNPDLTLFIHTQMPGNVMYSVDLCAYIRSFGMPILSDAKVEQVLARLVKIDAGISDEVRHAGCDCGMLTPMRCL